MLDWNIFIFNISLYNQDSTIAFLKLSLGWVYLVIYFGFYSHQGLGIWSILEDVIADFLEILGKLLTNLLLVLQGII